MQDNISRQIVTMFHIIIQQDRYTDYHSTMHWTGKALEYGQYVTFNDV